MGRTVLRQALPAIGAGLLLTVVIAFLGALLGPTWQPRPYESVMLPTSDTSIAPGHTLPSVGTYEWTTTETELELAPGATVTVRVREPIGAGDGLPAVVFLHGAGTAVHTGFAAQAEALASAGIVTVVPDKRMDTYTTAHRDYAASAADYHASVVLARSLQSVDPARVGVYGESEGAYIAPIVAAEDEDVAFVVLVSAPVVPPRQQAAYAVHTYLEATGVPEPIFRLIPRALGAEFPLGVVDYVDFDPQPYQQRLSQPVLVVYGTGDNSMPQAQGAAQIIGDAAVAGNDAVTVRYYEGANHGIRLGTSEGPLAPGFAEDLARWIGGLPETGEVEPRVAGADPNQDIWAERPPAPPAFLSGNLMVASHLLPALVLAIGLVTGAVAAIRSRMLGRSWRTPSGGKAGAVHHPMLTVYLGTAAVLALTTWYVWINYVIAIGALATSYQQDPAVSFGGYAAENQVATAASFTLGIALFVWYLGARQGRRFGRLARVAAVA
nr:prolyl oligopeptidase family serine peptidase [Actinomycetales bacterium]